MSHQCISIKICTGSLAHNETLSRIYQSLKLHFVDVSSADPRKLCSSTIQKCIKFNAFRYVFYYSILWWGVVCGSWRSVSDWPFCELFFLWLNLHWTEYIFACFLPCLVSMAGVTFPRVPMFTDNSCTWSPTILSSDHRQSLHLITDTPYNWSSIIFAPDLRQSLHLITDNPCIWSPTILARYGTLQKETAQFIQAAGKGWRNLRGGGCS